MENCPFCNASVDPQLIVQGGTCPMCFGEIPGEEAPTNPGEEVKRKQEAADRRGMRMRALITLAFGGVLFASVLCVAAGLVLMPEEAKMAAVNFDEYEGWDDLEELAFEEAAPEAEVAAATKGADGKSGVKATNAGGTKPKTEIKGFSTDLGTPDLSNLPNGDNGVATNTTGPRGPRGSLAGPSDVAIPDVTVPSVNNSGLGGLRDNLGGGVQRAKVPSHTLTDDNEIINMAARVLSTEMKGLKQCYEQELKTTEDGFSGRWVVSLVIGKDGVPKNIKVVGAEVAPRPNMEACIAGKVQRWRFQPIKADFEVSKSARFSPS